MKKLHLIALASMVALSASAISFKPQSLNVENLNVDLPELTGTATSDGYRIQFCSSIATIYSASSTSGIDYRCYLYIPGDVATQIAGNKLSTISFCCGMQTNTSGLEGSIFVAEDIDGEPVSSTDVHIDNGLKQTGQNYSFIVQTATLAEPYTIKEGQGFYFGYTVKNVGRQDYVIGSDNATANPYCGTVELTYQGQKAVVSADEITGGHNLYLLGGTVGDKKAISNLGFVSGLSFKDFTCPTYEIGSTPSVSLTIANLGDNKLTKMEYQVDRNGEAGPTKSLTLSVVKGGKTTKTITLPAIVEGKNDYEVRVLSFNEVPAEVEKSLSCYGANADDTFPRMFLAEKFTGQSCGYCPMGIVGFEQAMEAHPGQIIEIAVFENMNRADPFRIAAYDPIFQYIPGLPYMLVNRDLLYLKKPSTANINSSFEKWKNNPAIAKVEIADVAMGQESISVTARSTFAFTDANADCELAFVVKEDGLSGTQDNYYDSGKKTVNAVVGKNSIYEGSVIGLVASSLKNVNVSFDWDGVNPASVMTIAETAPEVEATTTDIELPDLYIAFLSGKNYVVDETLKFNREGTTYSLDVAELNGTFRISDKEGNIFFAGYAKGSLGAMGGWEVYGSSVPWIYNDVARGIYDCLGLPESRLTSVVKGREYDFSYDVPLTNVKDPEKVTIVVMLLDRATGTVMNSCQLAASDFAGIESVPVDNVTPEGSDVNAPVEYYNLQGIRVINPTGGVYIRRQGNSATKILIR